LAKRDVDDIYPLTPLQEGMLFHSLYSPAGGDYLRHMWLRVQREVDLGLLEQSFSIVVNRHPALRSSVEWRGLERPLQLVHSHVTIPVEHRVWQERDATAAARWRDTMLAEERHRGLDMASPPLMRLTFLRGPDGQREVLWTVHHLLFDGWGWPLLLGELRTCYRALARGESPSLPERRPYRDYIAWLAERDSSADEAWWRGVLDGLETPTRLLDEDRRAELMGDETASETLLLSTETTERLKTVARANRVTLSTLVIGAWGVLLSRYTRSSDVVFGLTVSGRPAEMVGVESMIGLFINTVPVRVRVPDEAAISTWLQRLQAEQVQLREHEHTALVDVQAWSELPPNTPLFDTLLVFRYPPDTGSLEDDDEIFELRPAVERTNYPLTLECLVGSRVEMTFIYDGQRFSGETVLRLRDHLGRLLEGMAARPGSPLGDLEMLTSEEIDRQVIEWNATDRDFPRESCVHDLVADQARRTPDAIALTDGQARLTYAELDERAARLATFLREIGLGPGGLAGVCIQRSIDMVVALLAVFKAGAAYVPLEPDQPHERLALMLAEAAPVVVITTGEAPAAMQAMSTTVVRLDAERTTWMTRPLLAASDGDSAQLAYVLFTSGSTGTPKGVMVEHRSLVNQLVWRVESFRLGPEDRVLQKTRLGFDVSLWELFCPLIVGAMLVLLEPDAHGDPKRVAAAIRSQRITAIHFVPSMLQAFLDATDSAGCETVRLVASSGEALSATLARRAFASFGPGVELRNLYGPTEAAVDVTSWRCDPRGEAVVPIGRPVANTQLYVLDARLRLLPVGAPGELYIGGVQLARGYLNRPDLTAERFLDSPFRPGERIYRTGDLAQYRQDGTVEYLGRNDSQVKIRGNRIELGEIEAALAAHPGVANAAILLRADSEAADERTLVAYVAPAVDPGPQLADLRAHLAARVPTYMMPSAFVMLEALPLTPSGKIDRRALPAPDGARLTGETSFVAPRTRTESRIAAIWARTLKADHVGVHDDFFESGGHSLLAVRLLGGIEREFGVDIPMISFFGGEVTVARLAEIVEGAADRPASSPSVVGVHTRGASPVIFFVYPDESSMLTLRHFTEPLGSDHRIVGLLPERNGRRFDRSLSVEDLAQPMLRAIREVQPSGAYRIAGYSFGGLLAYELASLLRASGDEVAWLGLLDAAVPGVDLGHRRRRLPRLWRIMRQRDRGLREALALAGDVVSREFRALLVRLHVRPMQMQDWDWRGASKLAGKYACRPNDAPLNVFATGGAERAKVSSLGWDTVHRGPLRVHQVLGDHFSMWDEPYISILVGELVSSVRSVEERAEVAPS
jgi:amino acid adenylation domain-containing protein